MKNNSCVYIALICFVCLSFIVIPCVSKETNTYFILSKENKIIPSSKYIGISNIDEFISLINNKENIGNVRAILADGHHYITNTLQLNDCKNKISIEAYHDGKAILTSYHLVSKNEITMEADNVISFPCSSEVIMLNVNNKPVSMSYSVTKKDPYKMKQFSGFKKENLANTYSAIFDLEEINKMEIGSYIFIFCKWIQYRLKVTEIDYIHKKVTMSGIQINVPYIVNDKNVFYTICNSRKLLKPSNFCYNENKVYYQLDTNEKFDNIEINKLILSNLINISNCKEGITLKGIVVSGATMDNLFIKEVQGGANFPSAINIQNSANVNIENCEFVNNSGYSIKIGNNSTNCKIQNNYLHDLQGGGILIGNYNQKDSTNNILIKNNLIKSFGRLNANSEGILVTKAHHITITNNTICDGYYTGISLGWTWGFGNSYSYNNYVANNHIHHLMQCVLSDGAGIYTLGNQKGTVIENNYIHDIVSRVYSSAGSSLLYFDEGTSNTIARNNICYGAHSGFHEHYGKRNILENNLFAYTNLVSIRLSNPNKDDSLMVRNNILIVDCGTAYNKNLTQKAIINNNCSLNKTIINKENGLIKQNISINICLDVNNLYKQKLINEKFKYGVMSDKLNFSAKLSKDYLNKQNRIILEHFSPCSSYFKRFY